MTDSNGRDYLFDNLKGILIFCVVYAHFLKATTFQTDTLGGAVYCIFFCFIMQSFLFVSGYFSKDMDTSRAKAVKAFLFPYFILTLVMYSARVLIFGFDNASLHFIKPSMALWYLLALFFYRYGLKAFVKIPHFLPVSFFLSLASGFVPFLDERLSLGRVFGFLPFFILGYCFKPYRKAAQAAWLDYGGDVSFTAAVWYRYRIHRDRLGLHPVQTRLCGARAHTYARTLGAKRTYPDFSGMDRSFSFPPSPP